MARRSLLLLALCATFARADVLSYCAAPDPSFAWQVGPAGPGYSTLSLTSQTWQGLPWKHTITLFKPAAPLRDDLCLLFITGGSFRPTAEAGMYAMMATGLKLPVAVLWDIPNQPLFDGKREDVLIAYTFAKQLETKDDSWPLLFPMTKAVVRAMDAIAAFSQQQWGKPITRFITSGGSKRGWTTWFTAAVDPRVVAIIPMVYDNLNLNAQMKHQQETWNGYSPQIEAYTKLGLQDKLQSPEGRRLSEMVDPWALRDKITVPKLIICGTNDRYWTVDALNLYRGDLKGDTWHLYVPNSGHGLNDIGRPLGTAAAFAQRIATGDPIPQPTWQHGEADGQATLRVTAAGATKVALWSAVATEGKFYEAKWASSEMTRDGDAWVGRVPVPAAGQVAVFGECTYLHNERPVNLSTTLALHGAR